MAVVRPFKAIRPAKEYASQIAALPYDVYNRQEAKAVVPIVSTALPIVTVSRLSQALNALSPILLTEFPIEAVLRFLQP